MNVSTDQTSPASASGHSLLVRVFLRVSLTVCAVVALVVGVLYLEFQNHMDSLRDRSLSGQAADIARHLQVDSDGAVSIDLPAALAATYRFESSRYRYAVLDPSGLMLAKSKGVNSSLDPDGMSNGVLPRFVASLDAETGRLFYGASIGHTELSRNFVIQVQQSAEHSDVVIDTFLDELGGELIWISLLVFASMLFVTYWTLSASLSSLTRLSRQAVSIGPESLERRLSIDGVPSEVQHLVAAINGALDRVEDALHQQRRFTADAAHEMRTPISILRAHVGMMEKEQAIELSRDLNALDRVVAQLLKLAQVDSMDFTLDGEANLHEVAVNVASLLAPAAVASGRSIAVTGDQHVLVRGDADALEVAVRNLLENALTHTTQGSEVEIRVSAVTRSVSVLDCGPGVPQSDREQVFQRFWRRQRDDSNGAGLGLSIVARVVAAHAASVNVANRDEGGAVFTITFAE